MPNKTKLYGLRSSEVLISHFINEFDMPNKTKPYRLSMSRYFSILPNIKSFQSSGMWLNENTTEIDI